MYVYLGQFTTHEIVSNLPEVNLSGTTQVLILKLLGVMVHVYTLPYCFAPCLDLEVWDQYLNISIWATAHVPLP